jgi:putative exosortase-associated protein (TIGR04073 family)
MAAPDRRPALRSEIPLYKRLIPVNLRSQSEIMRTQLSLLSVLTLAGLFASGCANVEQKFGRGLANTFEIVRLGELRRTKEQTSLFESPDTGRFTGTVRGISRTIARTGIGIYEIATAPLPPYGPVFTDHFAPGPVYPDNYAPGMVADAKYDTDTLLGFSGGDVAPLIPGSRFRIFDTH